MTEQTEWAIYFVHMKVYTFNFFENYLHFVMKTKKKSSAKL